MSTDYTHLFPALSSVTSDSCLELSYGGRIYTTEIGKCYQSGLFLFLESKLSAISQRTMASHPLSFTTYLAKPTSERLPAPASPELEMKEVR